MTLQKMRNLICLVTMLMMAAPAMARLVVANVPHTLHDFDRKIEAGKSYTFAGYLGVREVPGQGFQVLVFKNANGNDDSGSAGHKISVALQQGTLAENLVSLARRYGPATPVMVLGLVLPGGELAVQAVEADVDMH